MVKNIFLTGVPGVGKSTVVQAVIRRLQEASDTSAFVLQGFYTEEVRGTSGRIGFDIVTLSGKRGQLARVDNSDPRRPRVGKYYVDLRSFESLVLSEMCCTGKRSMCVIDEVGKMELLSAQFYPAVRKALDSSSVVLGTIPVPGARILREVEEVRQRKDVVVITVTYENRDRLVEEVTSMVINAQMCTSQQASLQPSS